MAQWGPWYLKWWNRHRHAMSIRSASSFVKAISEINRTVWELTAMRSSLHELSMLRRGVMQSHYWCHYKMIGILGYYQVVALFSWKLKFRNQIGCAVQECDREYLEDWQFWICVTGYTLQADVIYHCLFVWISCGSWHLKLVTRMQKGNHGNTMCSRKWRNLKKGDDHFTDRMLVTKLWRINCQRW